MKLRKSEKAAQTKKGFKSMALRVLITLQDGEHRVHVNGDCDAIEQLVCLARDYLTLYRSTYPAMASGPEEHWQGLRLAWNNSDNPLAHQALSLLKEARQKHLLDFPNCPYGDLTRYEPSGAS